MARRSLASLFCSLAAALALAAPALAATETPIPTQSPAAPTPPTAYVPGQIIVVWEEGASHREKTGAGDDAEVDLGETLGNPDFQLVEIQQGQSTTDALAELRSDPAVAVAERNSLLTPATTDPLFGQQWALQNNGPPGVSGFVGAIAGDDINATTAWEFFTGLPGLPGTGAVVADIDSGYRFAGSDLDPVKWTNPGEGETPDGVDNDGDGIIDDNHGADFVGADWEHPTTDGNPTDDNLVSGGHGVHTAGIIGAVGDNGFGTAGVAWDARIMPLRVCANAVSPPAPALPNSLTCPAASIIKAIEYAGAHGARVANISLTSTSFSTVMLEALGRNPQTLFVIAAGNDGKDNDAGGAGQAHYPCNYVPTTSGVPGAIDNVVCVAATNQKDELASFSDWGKTSVDLGAPGTEILSTYPLEAVINEKFEETDAEFNEKWKGDFGRAEGTPLTSSGMSDSPEVPPVPGSTRETELAAPISVPAGYGNCVFAGRRFLSLSGGTFTQEVLKNGVAVLKKEITANTSGSTMQAFTAEPTLTNLAGSAVNLRFRYEAGPSPPASSGVWLDDLSLTCYQATGVAPGYAFLQGTSMAAPEVSGTAALLFSIQPAASVTTVRKALLAGVDSIASLSGKTVTGGRIDATKALAQLDTTPPGVPVLTATDPPSPGESNNPRIIGSESDPSATVRIYQGAGCSGSPVAQGSQTQLVSPGITVTVADKAEVEFSAKAIDPAQNPSGCSNSISYKQEDDEIAPVAPQLTATNPASPAASATPRILGVAEAKSTVRLYSNENCSGTPVATATAEALIAPGIPVSVPSASTVTFWATATDTAQKPNVSPCSLPISYTNNSLIEPIVIKPPTEEPPPNTSCTVPKVAGKTLVQAKAALNRSLCKTGKVTKPKPQPGRKLGPLVVKSSSPAAGAVSASGVVNLKLGPKPKARRR